MVNKVRENRARRQLDRRGYRLQKRRRHDPHAWDYQTYQIVDLRTGGVVYSKPVVGVGRGFGLSLDDVEAWLRRPGT